MVNSQLRQSGWNYEETVDRIEAIIDRVESGELPLEEVFEQFAVAVECLQECEGFLARGKDKMDLAIELLAAEPDF
ncbi:MAG: exodeoxyribonuclease VII small subunit [Microcoleus sp. PH2017_29_MFU_D_A]|jgi:exodeoxyribonuclease VII small subunit|uniref:exodeoxyribonuclease VII small subunit n=1 Tax=unclassified Microcoleus TaxID=2642155 RepID=UPI001D497CA9|nr:MULTISPECIES: exodeoxyribonuclease VII small subunit [unclassified Microcoleus]MCC3416594.1 exodeoxyribonuclease VII small subunit [Microcoleus sp. PH2017_07_MST_O_A]MCC3430048.1 exodeoxyribonuclease VII small subunit [Microcoleus sp. PH2017_04_SCI_O_A]MCC3440616.1 exodeoxyribonuclease VII small subunit [Microcoleus sp. PH2017_03_ELD_O_A]MCC3465568.1 exodeoxyribonuclease VII small subunit [Microcoleus sp. PH2017_06_SFM_O_A]MCC3505911.1 exodeoxyribonuclease VII small subunit [Microcoleus sp.